MPDRSPRRPTAIALAAVLAGGVALAGCTSGASPAPRRDPSRTVPPSTVVTTAPGPSHTATPGSPSGSPTSSPPVQPTTDPTAQPPATTSPPLFLHPVVPVSVRTPARPNIVFVLTDDLAKNLTKYMPHLRSLRATGMSFDNYTVSNSLCCPSRASIFTGMFPHNSGVRSNIAPSGGYGAFQKNHDGGKTFAVALKRAGYHTGFFGKYLNQYTPNSHGPNHVPVPLGWTLFGGVGKRGYTGYDYTMAANHHLLSYGHLPGDYATNVIDRSGQNFIRSSVRAKTPFFVELSTFAPHYPYTPAPQDAKKFPNVTAVRTPRWDTTPANAPQWLTAHAPLTPTQVAKCNEVFRQRVRAVQAVDRMIGHLEDTLRTTGQLQNTVFVFSSDNGMHIGDYRLTPGKLTAFDTDVNVPLIVSGPGIAAGSSSDALVQNIDLAPTFEDLAGLPASPWMDGKSAVPLLHQEQVPWRQLAFIEHFNAGGGEPGDPDEQPKTAGTLPSYDALRSPTFTYVRYADGEHEYYDRSSDPWMLDNIYNTLDLDRRTQLDQQLDALAGCSAATCWTAGQPG